MDGEMEERNPRQSHKDPVAGAIPSDTQTPRRSLEGRERDLNTTPNRKDQQAPI